jgi:hypothetical protein
MCVVFFVPDFVSFWDKSLIVVVEFVVNSSILLCILNPQEYA